MGPPGEPAAGRRPRWLAASPRAVALRLLAARFGPAAGGEDPAPEAGAGSGPAGPRPVFDLADFQADAVWRASEILARRRGVLIADSVGLGKTYVALALAERELRRGGRVAVVTPAALRRDWVPALRRLADGLGVRQTSGLGVWRKTAESVLTDGPATTCADHALPVPPAPGGRTAAGGRSAARSRSAPGGRTAAGSRPAGAGGPRPSAAAAARARGDPGARPPPLLAWLSHARLSRGTHRPERLVPLDLVVVDEAHAFRSPRTRRYRALAALCRGSRVVLLTATPVNNAASDLYHQLRLFAGDGDFRDIGVADLGAVFRAVTEDAAAARSALAVLRQVMIRRTRPFLREHYAGVRLPGRGGKARVLAFPERAPPRPIRYSLQAAYPGLLDDIAETLAALILAPYAPGEYGADGEPAARGVAELLRLALLKRLESSVAAFRASIARLVRYYEACDGALAAGWLLAPAEHRRLLEIRGDGDVVQLVFPELALRPAPAGLDVARMRADVRAELDALQALERALAGIDPSSDPKLAALLELLEGEARGSKVVVFTEFRDTARHLWRALVRRGGVALVDGGGAFLGLNPCGRRQAIERFAPRSNGAREPAPRERVDLLIATDVLSEGLNLQDANRVVSYDLPWNPVRLIQRVGRVDRLGSPHPVVYSDHFLPDRGLEPLLGLVARLRAKLLAIGRTVGG
ncbi:MAG TPA: helicase-related protein, partial [Longimicrobiales bacterium]